MPPNNHAARLREMAEYERSKAGEWHRQSTMITPTCGYSNAACARARQLSESTAAALLAGAEALEKVAQLGWRPIAEAPENAWLFVGKHSYLGWVVGLNVKNLAVDNKFTHYLPQPDPPPKEPKA